MINRAARIIFCLNEKIGKGLKAILNSTTVNGGSHTMDEGQFDVDMSCSWVMLRS